MRTYIFKTLDSREEIILSEEAGKKKVEMLRNKMKMIIDDTKETVTIVTPYVDFSTLSKEIEY
ncbi:MAG: hypothetical protein KJI69_04730 [Patescibacteria group bacterium]|nr:hypothetical protein [Patescibacteria group bacterium]